VTTETGLASAALAISLLALWYTMRAFALKAGTRIRGSFSFMSSISCADQYVSNIALYNLKDRAVAVFKIHLEVGRGYFIELEDFPGDPLILRPFEAWTRSYEPIEMYTVSMHRVSLKSLIDNRAVRKRLVLSTADGRYVVKDWIRVWNPILLFFQNNAAAVIRPRRSEFKGKAYGENALYVIELVRADGESEIVPVYKGDHRFQKFRQFRLTAAALESAVKLEEFLLEQAVAGVLECKDVKVSDLEAWRKEAYKDHSEPPLVLPPNTWFRYHIMGRLSNRIDTYRMRNENRRLAKQRATRD
jgi:hypothetical protein